MDPHIISGKPFTLYSDTVQLRIKFLMKYFGSIRNQTELNYSMLKRCLTLIQGTEKVSFASVMNKRLKRKQKTLSRLVIARKNYKVKKVVDDKT